MKCEVANCKNVNGSQASNISFFVFPANKDLKKKWVSFCRREKSFNPENGRICMLHFKPQDIENGLQYDMGFAKHRVLKRGTVPTIYTDAIGNVELSAQRSSRIEKRENKKIVKSLLKKSYAEDAAQQPQTVELNKNKKRNRNPLGPETSERLSITRSRDQANVKYNVLNWYQTVEAIREYNTQNPQPTVKQLALKYNVSEAVMRNVLHNRKFVLQSYEELTVKRQKKIDLLYKVMYEFIQRSMLCNLTLDEEKMLEKAQEVCDGIDIANFEPTISWLNDFKLKYGITGFDTKSLRETVKPREGKHRPLTALDLIAHVAILEKKEENNKRKNRTETETEKKKKKDNKMAKVYVESSVKSPHQPAAVMRPENDHGIKVGNEKEGTEAETIVSAVATCHPNTVATNAPSNDCLLEAADSKMLVIKSVDGVFEQLRLLEEFAMLQENYRAIGLLTQLEHVFKQSVEGERKV